MNYFLYFLIFGSKVVENMLATLRLIVVANGKKWLGAFLQLGIAVVWILVTGAVIFEINKDYLKIVFFALGSFVGSIGGSVLEEKIAVGSNMIMIISNIQTSKKIEQSLRDKGYAVTVLEGNGKTEKKNMLFVMTKRKKSKKIVEIIKVIDKDAMIISENATSIYGGYKTS